ncbi:putative ribonuclease III [Yellowstone lake phycodnavirus 1]|jgi:ribonuclease-3|uniref:putative ribonuclease III n=1 Tax=Yellowstone lake phycodnavirus 1 TaxID=1586713 RepID=UPI0006EB61E2|nr:putative ribonuclease III [Yellowstone lake phycodnavirus 1]BAT22141.1 putative ribonuclease III [Yellowstone lake phycodnavirus 1]
MEPAPTLDVSLINSLVGTKIKNTDLYQRARTHKSALKRYSGLTGSYETLEFMGDSVLGFIITKHLFDQYEKEQEGFLTKARTKMVRGKTLCEISKKLGLHELILMDEKGQRNSWNTNPNIMEDAFEALVGAIYLDLGMIHAKRFVLDAFTKVETNLTDDNYKDQLMRWCQALKMPLPEYRIIGNTNGMFCVQLVVDGLECGCGFATSKKEAEQNAAQLLLKTDIRFKNKQIPTNGSKNQGTDRTDVPRTAEPRVACAP